MENAADIMNTKVVCVEKSRGLCEIVRVISNSNISSVIVTENGKPIGIITERDIIKKIVNNSPILKNKKLADIMSKNELITVTKNAKLNEIHSLMNEKHIRHLPVTEDGKVIGIISHGDIAKRANIINTKNVSFMRFQNIQTAIIIGFFIVIALILMYKIYFSV